MAEVNSVLMPAVNFKHTVVFSCVEASVAGNRMNTLAGQVSEVWWVSSTNFVPLLPVNAFFSGISELAAGKWLAKHGRK